MKKEYTFRFHYSEDGEAIAITIKKHGGKVVGLSPKDFKCVGNVLTLSKNPEDYFNPPKGE